jgi:hypothetical protein
VCAGHPIREVHVIPARVFSEEHERLPGIVRWAGNAMSWRTRPAAINGELRFRAGEPCDPRRLAESERILRAQPHIREASITTAPAPGDSVDVEVTTHDEWSLGGNIRFDTRNERPLRAARITEENLLGRGIFAQMRYDDYGRQPGLVFDLLHPQFPGRTDAEVVGGKTSVGPVGEVTFRHQFESEFDRFAGRVSARWREEPFIFNSRRFNTVVQPQVSAGADVGLLRRWGPFGRQALLGLSLAAERLFATDDIVATLPADDSAAAGALVGRYTERRRLSLNLIAGVRNIRFVPHAGLDAVNAREDVREGYEIRAVAGAAFGYALGLQEDRFLLVDVYAGVPLGARTLLFLRSRAEGRWLPDVLLWENMIGSADLYAYTTIGSRAGVVLGLQGAGGWNTNAPFQLQVGGANALRGFRSSSYPAGRRVVMQAEHRYFLGTVFSTADIGTALFADVGRGWAGDAPFGENSPTLVALGAGLRVGFPSGSRYTTRLDLAWPVSGGHGAELRFTLRQQFGITRGETMDVERSRMPLSTIALFNFSRY